MKVRLEPSPDSNITVVKAPDGSIQAIEFEPLFGKKNAMAILGYGEVTNAKGVSLEKFALTVAGSTGKVSKSGRSVPVTALADEIDPDGNIRPPEDTVIE